MSFVSYAQNFEDVMLWRALKDVKNGFYIDIGANHPAIDSVTKAFYENGWSGINVEPEYELYELLKEDRVRDINLNIAISSKLDYIDFYVSSTRGWSTTDKDSSINLKEKESFLEKRKVNAMTLDKLCNEYDVEEVHFLKIDVEGAEKDVLESFSFKQVRPWICVIEATKPTTRVDVSSEWEDILYNHDYIFAYFDALNKYYVSSEHKELLKFFQIPPNMFDDFISANHRDSLIKSNNLEVKLNKAEVNINKAILKVSEAEVKIIETEVKAKEYFNLYISVINSNSWKMTKSLRLFGKFIRWFVIGIKHWITFSPTSRPRRVLKYYMNSNPKFKTIIMKILHKFPAIEQKLRQNSIKTTIKNIETNEALFASNRSKCIFKLLEHSIENKKEL